MIKFKNKYPVTAGGLLVLPIAIALVVIDLKFWPCLSMWLLSIIAGFPLNERFRVD